MRQGDELSAFNIARKINKEALRTEGGHLIVYTDGCYQKKRHNMRYTCGDYRRRKKLRLEFNVNNIKIVKIEKSLYHQCSVLYL